METKSPKEDKNATDCYLNWFDRNNFIKILAIIDSSTFVYKIKKVNSGILTLKTWLIILKIIQLVKYQLKKV